jgi:hypothetical protein
MKRETIDRIKEIIRENEEELMKSRRIHYPEEYNLALSEIKSEDKKKKVEDLNE